MISATTLMSGLIDRGLTLVTGVPCSFLTPIINLAISDDAVRHIGATQEGEAVAIAAGAWLGGGLGCAVTQNSGLGNMVNPITSLLNPAGIPVLLLVTWRGQPGLPDEPQHELMGRITTSMLDLMDVGWDMLPDDPTRLAGALDTRCRELRRTGLPQAFVIAKGVVADEPLLASVPTAVAAVVTRHGGGGDPPSRIAALERIQERLPDTAAVISTTGKTSRELYTLSDRQQHFYMVGAMGSALSVGLGVALHSPRPVVVIDGDGAALMRLGSLATTAAYGPANLVHILLDNGVHDSTGGQATVSPTVDLAGVAAACGYAQVHRCGSLDDLSVAIDQALAGSGPSLIYLPIRPGSLERLGRPRVTPREVATRFRDFVAGADRAVVTTGATGVGR
jgi:phosphonopyruvate decarboxylase